MSGGSLRSDSKFPVDVHIRRWIKNKFAEKTAIKVGLHIKNTPTTVFNFNIT